MLQVVEAEPGRPAEATESRYLRAFWELERRKVRLIEVAGRTAARFQRGRLEGVRDGSGYLIR
ncbi:hypothetical protein [Micromonospora sp. NPDC005979]|uniref:hypothetical protein n=1 Tax=Micromonospora sp. NPDC005979 TaxID=3156726 RepID=UPI00339F4045